MYLSINITYAASTRLASTTRTLRRKKYRNFILSLLLRVCCIDVLRQF